MNGQPVAKATYLRGNQLIARYGADGTKSYYQFNEHGDVTELSDGSGNVQNSYSYDIWGNPVVQTEAVDNLFRYSGEYWDKATSLQYLRVRWYDPDMGWFLNEDTYQGELKNPLTLNLYTYVENNPLTYVDPTGNNAVKPGCLSLCFAAGTQVLTEEGYKNIEDVELGDNVLARNEQTGELSYQKVIDTFHRIAGETYEITVNGTKIITTEEYSFWVKDVGWVTAGRLQIGDFLIDEKGTPLLVESIRVNAKAEFVYNFTVDNDHNYFGDKPKHLDS